MQDINDDDLLADLVNDVYDNHSPVKLGDIEFGDRLRVHITWNSRPGDTVSGTVDQVREFGGAPEIKLDCGRDGRAVIHGDHRPPTVRTSKHDLTGRVAWIERIEDTPTVETIDAPDVERDTDRVTDPVRPEGDGN